jgi:hypothetical protein
VNFNYWDLGHQAEGTAVRVALEGNSANVGCWTTRITAHSLPSPAAAFVMSVLTSVS